MTSSDTKTHSGKLPTTWLHTREFWISVWAIYVLAVLGWFGYRDALTASFLCVSP